MALGIHNLIVHDGDLYTWGENNNGQLGDGTTTNRTSPTKIGASKWASVAAGTNHSLGVTEDGDLYTWGQNNIGQLGDGTTTNRTSPTKIGTMKWKSVAAGGYHSLGLTKDGDLYAWGQNNYGQLGDGTTTNRTSPTKIGTMKWASVATGTTHSLGITEDGDLYAWGYNANGQVGDGTTTHRTAPTKIGTMKWASVAAGNYNSFGVTKDGDLYTWGLNASGQLGDGTTTNRTTPIKIGSLKWASVAAGTNHSLGVTKDGDLYTWGYNANGQLGDGTTTQRNVPSKIGTMKWKSVAAGSSHSLGITTAGSLYTWGLNNSGQLGDGTTTNRIVPTFIMKLLTYLHLINHQGVRKVYGNQAIAQRETTLVPVMTSNAQDGFVLTTDSTNENVNFAPFKLFDGVPDAGNGWANAVNQYPVSFSMEMPTREVLTSYELTFNFDTEPLAFPRDWTISGSDDNVEWSVIDEQTVAEWAVGETKRFVVAGEKRKNYKYIKFTVNSGHVDDTYGYVVINEMKLCFAEKITGWAVEDSFEFGMDDLSILDRKLQNLIIPTRKQGEFLVSEIIDTKKLVDVKSITVEL